MAEQEQNIYKVDITWDDGTTTTYHVASDGPPTFPDSGWWVPAGGASTEGKGGPFKSTRVNMDKVRSTVVEVV